MYSNILCTVLPALTGLDKLPIHVITNLDNSFWLIFSLASVYTSKFLIVIAWFRTDIISFSWSSVHGGGALRAVPFSLGWCGNANTWVVEPLYRTLWVVTSHHVTVRNLVAYAVPRFVGIVGPIRILNTWIDERVLQQIVWGCRWSLQNRYRC